MIPIVAIVKKAHFVPFFQKEECNASINYYRALNGEAAPAKKTRVIINQILFRQYKPMFSSGDITIETYMKYVNKM